MQARSYLCTDLRHPRDTPRLGDITFEVQSLLVGHCAASENFLLSAPVILGDDPTWQSIFDGDLDPRLDQGVPSSAAASTVAVGRFGSPIQCVEPSPDGRWLAVLSDAVSVTLLPEALDYALTTGLAIHFDDCLKTCAAACSKPIH
jgi:hypothetical protein